MTEDYKKLDRVAQYLVVEIARGYGSPPQYKKWEPLWDAKVDRIEINHGSKPSVATVWLPTLRWDGFSDCLAGDMVRIRTDHPDYNNQTVVFCGFVTTKLHEFSGGSANTKGYERNAFVCQDFRWLLATTSPLVGQFARGPDDYDNYGTDSQSAKTDSYTYMSGRRAIFNADGRPNRDPTPLSLNYSGGYSSEIPIFADSAIGEYWTAKDMLRYVLSSLFNKIYDYLPIYDPEQLPGLDHTDWDKILNHISVDGLNVIEAVTLICKHIGWSFRQDSSTSFNGNLIFYKLAAADSYIRNYSSVPTILHQLHAPEAGDDISTPVGEGKKMLWSMTLADDITGIINTPVGIGAPDRFEFTAELVPAWLDSELSPDTSDDNANLFFTDAQLQDITDKNSKTYYKYYHPRGDSFKRDVGRKWSLNESGKYSAGTYDRGIPFDFSTVIDADYIKDSVTGKRLYGPFKRQLLACLTLDKDTLNSVGIKVEFSFDGGTTWQVIPASISSLPNECGIYIEEANMAEMVEQTESEISGGDLDGVQLNYYTSLADDKLNSRSFKDGQWKTRVRVTASVQMDRRLAFYTTSQPASGSPFNHIAVYDFSEKYGLAKRTASSQYILIGLSALDVDSTYVLGEHLKAIRDANQDASISGQFTLERLWLGDGAGQPDFMVGDCIEKITGREFNLQATLNKAEVYPEIIQIIYTPETQMTRLITRDLRFAEVLVN